MSEYMDDFFSLDSIKNWFSSDTPAAADAINTGALYNADAEDAYMGQIMRENAARIIPSVTNNLPVSANELSWGKVWDTFSKSVLPAVLDSPGVSGTTKNYTERVNADGTVTRIPVNSSGLSGNMGLIIAVAVIGIGAIYLMRK